MTNEQRIIEIIKEVTGIETIKISDNFRDDLGCDSLDAIEIVMEIEEQFEISVTDDDAFGLVDSYQTIGELVELIEKYLEVR